MMWLRCALLITLAVFMAPAAAKQEPISWPLNLGPDIGFELWVDESANTHFDEIRQLPADAWQQRSYALMEGYTYAAHWLRFSIPELAQAVPTLWLEISPAYLDQLDLFYQPNADIDEWVQITGGDIFSAADRPIDWRHMVFPLESTETMGPIYLRLQTSSTSMLFGKFWIPEAFAIAKAKDSILWGLYFGFALFSVVLALVLGAFTRDRTLLSVAAFGIAYVFIASMQGFMGWSLFRHMPLVAHHMVGLSLMLSWIAIIWLAREALDLKNQIPWLDRITLVWIGLMSLLLLSIPLGHYTWGIQWMSYLGEPMKWVATIAGFWLWYRRGPQFAFFAVPFFLHNFFAAASVMSAHGYYPFTELLYVTWQYLMVFLMLMVIGLAAYRIQTSERERRDREQLARELKLEREASFLQRQFVSMVSHEFRTPLAIIDAVITNIRARPDLSPEERHAKEEKILRASARLATLTSNCLAETRLSTQELSLEPVNLITLIEEAAEIVHLTGGYSLELRANEKVYRVGDAVEPIMIDADRAMLRIALSNVLDNAAKYSLPGLIRIDVITRVDKVLIKIANRGAEIPAEIVPQLFERYFTQHPQGIPRRTSASAGLGLFIAHEIITQHGGALRLMPYQDGWVCFEFELTL